MTCDHIIAALPDFLEHQLPAAQRAQIQAHLASCAECAQLVADCQAVEAALPCWKVPAPQNLPTATQLLQQAGFAQSLAAENLATLDNLNNKISSQLLTKQQFTAEESTVANPSSNNLSASAATVGATSSASQSKDLMAGGALGRRWRQWWSGWPGGYLPWATAMAGALGIVVLVGYYYSNNKISMVAVNAPASSPPPAAPMVLERAPANATADSAVPNDPAREVSKAAQEASKAAEATSNEATSSSTVTGTPAAPHAPDAAPTAQRPVVKDFADKEIDRDLTAQDRGTGEASRGQLGAIKEDASSNLSIKPVPAPSAAASLPPTAETTTSAKVAASPAPAATTPSEDVAMRPPSANEARNEARNNDLADRSNVSSNSARGGIAPARPTMSQAERKESKITLDTNKDANALKSPPASTDTSEVIEVSASPQPNTTIASSKKSKDKDLAAGKAARNIPSSLKDIAPPTAEPLPKTKSQDIELNELELKLVTNDVETAHNQLQQLIKAYQGETSSYNVKRKTVNGEARKTSMSNTIVYLPRQLAEQFLEAIKKLGTVKVGTNGTKVLSLDTEQQQLIRLEAAKPRDEAKVKALKARIAELQKRAQQTKFVIDIAEK